MSLTLIAIILVPLYLKAMLDPAALHAHMKNVAKDPSLSYVITILLFVIAMMIVSFNGLYLQFEATREVLLSWIAVFTFLKGIALLFPAFVNGVVNKIQEKHVPMLGTFGLLFALALVYLDTRVL